MPTARFHSTVWILMCVLLLAACAGAPPPAPTPGERQQVDPVVAFADGRYAEAAEGWERQALTASPQEAAALRVLAANAWLLAGRSGNARATLRWVDREILAGTDRARLDLVRADLAVRDERAAEAEALLQGIDETLPPYWMDRYRQIAANLQRLLDRPGSRDLSRAEEIARSVETYDPVAALELLRSLENVPSGELAWRAENPRADRNLTGWLDLTAVLRAHLVRPQGLESAIDRWKGRHLFHPLTREQALDLWLRYRQQFVPPSPVAVLVPGSGRFAAAGRAIRDGVVAAHADEPAGSELTFLNTGDDPLDAASAYFEAAEFGAQWIVGPVRPDSVSALLNLAGLSTPVLALNSLPAAYLPPAGLQGRIHGLSLSQEEEVRAIARAVRSRELRRAVILAPETEWGERMATIFREEFLRDDTQIVDSSRYLESDNDHSAVLERLLRIDESRARARSLENTLQMNLDYEPVRREDIDVIFLAANAVQGRLLRPQLRFHGASDVPVYATSRIYTGVPNPVRDQDLDGIRFPITPLQLQTSDGEERYEFSSQRDGAFASLHALGRDAWRILPFLPLMSRDPDFHFEGDSGTYRLGPGGNLVRDPAIAEFRGGRPVPVGPAGGTLAGGR